MTPEEYKQTFSLPFKEAESFFRNKLNIPTDKWDDLWKDQHAKGFMVAGANKAELLADFRGAVQKAIDGNMTLKDFQNRFDEIVKTHGWDYNGSRNWRSSLIYNTNVRTAYMAGRWQQLTSPGSKLPYLIYRHADGVRRPRPLHVAWDGLTLPADHPFWQTHYPPNGWRCHCTVFGASEQERQAAVTAGKGEPPEGWQATDDKTGAPVGIDKGWDYNVGRAAYGQRPDIETDKWQPLYDNWKAQSRPQKLPFDPVETKRGAAASSQAGMVDLVKAAIGGDDKIFTFEQDRLQYALRVNAEWLGSHLALDRGEFVPFLADLLTDPAEVWLNWEKNIETGKVRLGMNIVKGIDQGKGKLVFMTARVVKGGLLSWTFIPSSNPMAFNKDRIGFLAYQK